MYRFNINNGLTPATTYHFRVCAMNANGYSQWTNAIIGYSSNLPNTISKLSVKSITRYSVILGWSLLSSSVDNGYSISSLVYTLESSTCMDDTFSTIYSTTTETIFTATGYPGTCKLFRMKVTNNIGDSPYCEPIEVLFAEAPLF